LIVSVPATSANLGPGFDTLGLALDFRNRIEIRQSRFFSLNVKGEGAHFLRKRDGNIFLRIFNDTYRKLGGKNEQFRYMFYNNIPISRGLGSSSAVIVSAIAAAYEMAHVNVTKEEIVNRALRYEHHPDNIAPAAHGGFVASLVHKNQVKSIKHEMPKYLRAVMVIPDKPISTKASRTTLPQRINMDTGIFNISSASLLTAALLKGEYDLLRVASRDRLHQEIRMNNLPELFTVQKMALDNGALMSTLSGSGSSFFNLCFQGDAKILKERLARKFPKYRIEIMKLDNEGVSIYHH